MIAYVKGTLVKSSPMEVVIDVGGIGYQVLIPASAFASLPATGKEVMLYTSFVVRDVSHTLFGFLTEVEKELFEQVTAVSGVGPKLALSLIGHLSMDDLQRAISTQDAGMISRVPGIGKKTSQRLILELKDKLGALAPNPSDFAIQIKNDPQQQKIADAMNALINLGYNQAVAKKAIQKTLATGTDEIDLASLITESLKNV